MTSNKALKPRNEKEMHEAVLMGGEIRAVGF